jgi:hypothetical protein
MLVIWLILASVAVAAILAPFAEDHLDNGIEHHQADAPRDDDEPDLMASAA